MLSSKCWRPDTVLHFLAGLFGSMVIGISLAGMLGSAAERAGGPTSMPTLIIGTLCFHGMGMVLIGRLVRENNATWSEAFGFSSGRVGRSLLLAVLVWLLVLPLAWSLSQFTERVLSLFHVETVPQSIVQTLQSNLSLSMSIVLGLAAVFIAPVAEELIFRGVLYSFIKQCGYPRLAMWGTAILFAFIHNNRLTFLSLLLLALILTLLYETTNNLLAPILTHSLFNATNYFILLLQSH